MGKKTGPFRTTISVSQDLKARMDATTEQVNWSAVACRAFEDKLTEIASKKVRKTMDDVIQRLRASKLRSDNEQYKEGEEAGTRFTREDAEAEDLQNLAQYRESCGHEWDDVFTADRSDAPYSLSEWLHSKIRPREDCAESLDFWACALGDDDAERANDPSFAKGFCEGALDLWYEVKERV